MNAAHLHIAVNHVPIFTMIFGTSVLAVAIKRRSTDFRRLAAALFVLTGLFGWISMETGEKAAGIVMDLGQEFRPYIHEHAMAATWAFRSGIVVAILALVLEWAARKKEKWVKSLQWVLLILAIHGCTVMARTAYLGGLVRHSEIREGEPMKNPQ